MKLVAAKSCSPVALRPATEADGPFLRLLFSATRAPDFASLGMPGDQLEALLAMQYQARTASYATSHPAAEDHVILIDGRPAGRLLLEQRAAITTVVDIALLPEYRG